VRRTVPPSAEIEEQIVRLLAVGVGENPRESLSELARLMVIGAFVRGLSMRDIESLCEKAGLGKLSKTTAQRICTELRQRFEQFKRRDLYDVELAALFLDAVFSPSARTGPRRASWSPGASANRASACCWR
jgi:Transposase, Mutator family